MGGLGRVVLDANGWPAHAGQFGPIHTTVTGPAGTAIQSVAEILEILANLQLIHADELEGIEQRGDMQALLEEQARLLRQIRFGMGLLTEANLATVEG